MNMKRKLQRAKGILDPNIPKGVKLKKAAMITYREKSVIVPLESLENGAYRMEFIKKHGIPLPNEPLPDELPEYFCPNLCEVQEVNINSTEGE